MSHLSDAGLHVAADVIDLIEAAHHGDITTLSRAAARAHREHGIEALALLAACAAGLTEQLADTQGHTTAELITGMRQRAAA